MLWSNNFGKVVVERFSWWAGVQVRVQPRVGVSSQPNLVACLLSSLLLTVVLTDRRVRFATLFLQRNALKETTDSDQPPFHLNAVASACTWTGERVIWTSTRLLELQTVPLAILHWTRSLQKYWYKDGLTGVIKFTYTSDWTMTSVFFKMVIFRLNDSYERCSAVFWAEELCWVNDLLHLFGQEIIPDAVNCATHFFSSSQALPKERLAYWSQLNLCLFCHYEYGK